MSKKSCNLSVHDKILSSFTILTAHFFGNNDKNGEKIPIETKAALLKYYFAEECSVRSLVK